MILIVEDEAGIADIGFLQKKGFQVLTANSSDEALELWARERDHVDLLVTDNCDAGVNGKVLSERFILEKARSESDFHKPLCATRNFGTEPPWCPSSKAFSSPPIA